jgi:hypothetical protein
MGQLCRLVNELDLKEIIMVGRRYTWSNARRSPTLVKLARAICTEDQEALYPECMLQSHPSETSDHCPLILSLSEGSASKQRFHFRSFWTNFQCSWLQFRTPGISLYTRSVHFKES